MLLVFISAMSVYVSNTGHADIFYLDNGSEVEGRLVTETDKTYVAMTINGRCEIEKEFVLKVKKKEFDFDRACKTAYKEKFSKAKTADGFYKLGEWADERKMKEEAKKAYEKAIEIDPNHISARTVLGYRKYLDRWIIAVINQILS